MTNPGIPQMPHMPLGNTATDLASGAANFIAGLKAEQERQRQQAMSEALLNIRAQASGTTLAKLRLDLLNTHLTAEEYRRIYGTRLDVTGPDEMVNKQGENLDNATITQQTQRPFEITAGPQREIGFATPPQTPPTLNPTLPGGSVSPGATTPTAPSISLTGVNAPPVSPVFLTGPGGVNYRTPRQGGVATPVILGGEAGTPLPGGATAGTPLTTQGSESQQKKARDAFEMIQSRFETDRALQANPQAYNEAAQYMAGLSLADKTPIVGGVIKALIQNSQAALSPEAQAYFSSFMNLAAARAFSRGGATLTQNEIEYSLSALSPKPGEAGDVSEMRDRLIDGIIVGALAGNPAWAPFNDLTKRSFGFDLSKYTQGPGPSPLTPPPNPVTPGRTMNPRFAPRRP